MISNVFKKHFLFLVIGFSGLLLSFSSTATIRVWTVQVNFQTGTENVLGKTTGSYCSSDTVHALIQTVSGVHYNLKWTVTLGSNGDTVSKANGNFIVISNIPKSGDNFDIAISGDSAGNQLPANSFSTADEIDAPTIQISASPSTNVCQGTPVSITTTVSGSGAFTSHWNNGQITNSINVTQSGFYALIATDTSTIARCKTRAGISINVYPVPVLTPGGTITRCLESSLKLTAVDTKNSATLWSWLPANNLTIDPLRRYIAIVNKNNSVLTTVYTVTGTSGSNCSATTTFTVKVNPAFSLNIFPTDTIICKFTSAQLPSLTSGGSPFSGGMYKYSWSPKIGISDTSLKTAQFSAVSVSGIKYKLTATDSKNCTASDSVVVKKTNYSAMFVSDTMPLKDSITLCYGNSTNLKLKVANGYSPFSFKWEPSAYLIKNTDTTYSTTTLSSNISLKATVTDAQGCVDKDSVFVQVNPSPVPNLPNGGTLTTCVGIAGSIDITPAGKTASDFKAVEWTPPQNIQGVNSLTPTFTTGANESSTTYFVNITDKAGCTGHGTLIVNAKGSTHSTIQVDPPNPLTGDPANFSANQQTGFNYTWNFQDSSILAVGATASHVFKYPRVYHVTLLTANQYNCIAIDTIAVKVYRFGKGIVYIPTAFSPAESDDRNKSFRIFTVASDLDETKFQVYIYNIFGEKVFESSNLTDMINKGWTGEGYAAGVYTSVVKYVKRNGEKGTETHPLTLIK